MELGFRVRVGRWLPGPGPFLAQSGPYVHSQFCNSQCENRVGSGINKLDEVSVGYDSQYEDGELRNHIYILEKDTKKMKEGMNLIWTLGKIILILVLGMLMKLVLNLCMKLWITSKILRPIFYNLC